MIRIQMLPAAHGDCLLVEHGSKGRVRRILIDGGVARTYDALRARLLALPAPTRKIDLVVVTHVDADHIEGIVKMLTDETLDVSIGDVWFNGYEHLVEAGPLDFGGVQGEYLSALIRKRKLAWNAATDGRALCVPDEGPLPVFECPGGLALTLLSPTRDRLERMADAWEHEVQKAGLAPDRPAEALRHLETRGKRLIARFDEEDEAPDVPALAAEPYAPDTSPANGSSIAFLAETKGRRVLFAADAHAEVLVKNLERLLAARGLSVLELDAFKLPHHGSSANLSPRLLELVRPKRVLVSTNGRQFDHPDAEAIARIALVRWGAELVFNYRTEQNECWDRSAWKEEYRYATRYPETNESGIEIVIP